MEVTGCYIHSNLKLIFLQNLSSPDKYWKLPVIKILVIDQEQNPWVLTINQGED